MLAAGDTFRAAAIDQLKIWGERTGAPVVARGAGADRAGLAFDALKEARGRRADVLLIDTAGRLQNKQALMDELEKIVRVMRKNSIRPRRTTSCSCSMPRPARTRCRRSRSSASARALPGSS